MVKSCLAGSRYEWLNNWVAKIMNKNVSAKFLTLQFHQYKEGQRIQYEVIFSDEKVNASSMKSTNPGKGTTKSGKQSTGSER